MKFAAILPVILLLACVGCTKRIDEALIGKWGDKGQPGFLEFNADHTFVYSSPERTWSGQWSKIGNSSFKLQGSDTPTPLLLVDVKISGNQMEFTLGGHSEKMSRK